MSAGKKEIIAIAQQMLHKGQLFYAEGFSKEEIDNYFCNSIDRFADIALALQDCHRILDVGGGRGFLVSLLKELGHECAIIDLQLPGEFYDSRDIAHQECNVEVDPYPFGDNSFDAITCCQVLEHFTHSHLPSVQEMFRVLRPGGLVEIDVPNAVCWRNRLRVLKGRHITWDYEGAYMNLQPITYNGMTFYPQRHNREFTAHELRLLLETAGFSSIKVSFMRSTRYRTGFKRIRHTGTWLRDMVPSFRKSIIAYGRKPSGSQT